MPHTTSIFCISGWGGDDACWRGVVAALPAAASVRHVPWQHCLADRARTLRAAIVADERDVIVVGWSLGAIVAMEAAVAPPGNFRGLVLVAGTAAMSDRHGEWGVEPSRLRAMTAALRTRRPSLLEDFARLADESAAEQMLSMSSAFSSADLEAGLRYLAAADLRAELARIALPTIVLHGDADRVIPPAAGRLLAESLPAARHVAIRGAGHALPLSHPEAVARAVLETIDAVAAAR